MKKGDLRDENTVSGVGHRVYVEVAPTGLVGLAGVIPERYLLTVRRAEDRMREIGYEIAHLENERNCLKGVISAAVLGFDDEVDEGKKQYKKLFKK